MSPQGSQGLGFAIEAKPEEHQEGIYVKTITPGGAAAEVLKCLINVD